MYTWHTNDALFTMPGIRAVCCLFLAYLKYLRINLSPKLKSFAEKITSNQDFLVFSLWFILYSRIFLKTVVPLHLWHLDLSWKRSSDVKIRISFIFPFFFFFVHIILLCVFFPHKLFFFYVCLLHSPLFFCSGFLSLGCYKALLSLLIWDQVLIIDALLNFFCSSPSVSWRSLGLRLALGPAAVFCGFTHCYLHTDRKTSGSFSCSYKKKEKKKCLQ